MLFIFLFALTILWFCILITHSHHFLPLGQVYHMYIRMADACSALLESSWRDLKKTVTREYSTGTGPFDEYVATVVVPLVKAAHAATAAANTAAGASATAATTATAGSSKRSSGEPRA